MPESIRVLVVDDHRMFAEAIELLLANEDGIEIVGAVGTGEAAADFAGTHRPDVVLVDIDLPGMDGIEAMYRIREASPNSHLVVVTAFQQRSVMARAVEAGAAGFVPKTRAADDLVDVIRRAAAGEMVLPSGDIGEVLNNLQQAASDRSDAARLLGLLTSREVEILKLVADGHSTAEIAKHFFISPFTVQSHVKNILSKLGVHSKLEAVTFALRHGAVRVQTGTSREPLRTRW
jgi:DNA-binding NarL/FixJ family response regulator